jgi:hypothetical protein
LTFWKNENKIMAENFGDDFVLADSLDAVATCVTVDCDSGGVVHNAR